ncbi:MAG: hypothetical protein ACR2GR_11225 [Rhodothermales bacterium]
MIRPPSSIPCALRFGVLVLLLAHAAACDGPGPDPPTPNLVDVLGGDGQTGPVNTALPESLVVQVTNAAGDPLGDIEVGWQVMSGEGTVHPASAHTDGLGRAATQWTLGPTEGEQTVTATVEGLGPVPFRATATSITAVCEPAGPLPDALTQCRNWITFSPPPLFDPTRGIPASPDSVRAALQQLYDEGWRGLVTYSLDPDQGLDVVPRIAKEVGFTQVIAGLFWFDAAQLERERTAALAALPWIDGFVLGNEGLLFNRYTCDALEAEIARLREETGRPVTTSEPPGEYLPTGTCPARLAQLGEWLFPNIQPWFAEIREVGAAAAFVEQQVEALQSAAAARALVVKEAWWPTGGDDPAATEANQRAFFQRLAATDVRFVWGEAYDQVWKTDEGPQGPHWGLHTADRTPKKVIPDLADVYRGPY